MSKITLSVGLVLIALGVGFWLNAGGPGASVTALIPAFFGLPVAILGLVAMKCSESARKHVAHAAVVLTLLGTLGGLGMGLPKAIQGDMKTSVIAQLLMGAICLVHVVLSVRSFIAARKAQA